MNKKERLNEAVKHLKYKGIVKTHEDIAVKMKAGRPSVSSALAGNEHFLTDNFIRRFCKAFTEISYNWLLRGEGDMLSNPQTNVIDKNTIHMADTKKLAEIAKMKTRPLLPLKNKDIVKAINDYLQNHAITKSSFAKKLKMSPSSLQRYMKRKTFTTTMLTDISKELGYNLFALYIKQANKADFDSPVEDIDSGALITIVMSQRRMTNEKLGYAIGVSHQFISNRRNKKEEDIDILINLSKALKFNLFEAYIKRDTNDTPLPPSPEITLSQSELALNFIKRYESLVLENEKLRRENDDLNRIIVGLKNKLRGDGTE